jgi:hypothetical protein
MSQFMGRCYVGALASRRLARRRLDAGRASGRMSGPVADRWFATVQELDISGIGSSLVRHLSVGKGVNATDRGIGATEHGHRCNGSWHRCNG